MTKRRSRLMTVAQARSYQAKARSKGHTEQCREHAVCAEAAKVVLENERKQARRDFRRANAAWYEEVKNGQAEAFFSVDRGKVDRDE